MPHLRVLGDRGEDEVDEVLDVDRAALGPVEQVEPLVVPQPGALRRRVGRRLRLLRLLEHGRRGRRGLRRFEPGPGRDRRRHVHGGGRGGRGRLHGRGARDHDGLRLDDEGLRRRVGRLWLRRAGGVTIGGGVVGGAAGFCFANTIVEASSSSGVRCRGRDAAEAVWPEAELPRLEPRAVRLLLGKDDRRGRRLRRRRRGRRRPGGRRRGSQRRGWPRRRRRGPRGNRGRRGWRAASRQRPAGAWPRPPGGGVLGLHLERGVGDANRHLDRRLAAVRCRRWRADARDRHGSPRRARRSSRESHWNSCLVMPLSVSSTPVPLNATASK